MPDPEIGIESKELSHEISRICNYFVSGASRDRTGDLLLAKWALRPLTRCRTVSVTEIPDDFGPSNRSHVATVCRNHLLPTCSLTVWASTHVNITTPQDTAGVGATGRTRPGAEGAGPLA
jgi:hypothetical protein